MANLGGTFDANSVEPSAPIEILPPGNYPVQIVKSDMEPTKDGDGQKLTLELEIIDGPARGRRLWDSLNLVNRNPQAVEISQRTLSAICHAIGKLQVSDSEELHFKPLMAKVEVLPAGTDKNGYVRERPKNEVKGYSAIAGAAASTQAPPQRAATSAPPPRQPAPAASAAPPWRRAG